MTTTAPPGTYRAALRVREFDALAASSFVSVLGDSAAYLAATVLVYQRTGSPLLSAATFTVAFVPYLFGGTLLGSLVDRLAPRALLVGFDLLGAALVVLTTLPGVPVPAIFAVLFVLGALAPVRSGTAGALVAEVLPGDTFVAGRSVQRIASQTGQIMGTGLGGVLVGGFGARGALLADTASFLLSAGLVLALVRRRPARSTAADRPRLLADSLGGMRAVWSQRTLRPLLLLGWAVPFVAVAPEALGAPAVAQAGHSPAALGLWLAAIPVGTVAGDLLAVWTVPPRRRTALTWPLALAVGAVLVVFVFDPPLPVALGLLVLSGAASAYGLGLDQLVRDTTPPALLARTYTLTSTGLMVVQGLGFAVAGAVAELLPVHDVVALAGAVGVVVVLLLARSSRR